MAKAVVHEFEVVQVHEEHGDGGLAPPRASEGVLEAVHKQGSVGQLGQGVVERLVPQLLFELFAFGNVSGGDHDPPDIRIIKQVVDVMFEVAPGAVFVRSPKLYGWMKPRRT